MICRPVQAPFWVIEAQNMNLSQKCKKHTAPKTRKESWLQFCISGSHPYFGPQGPKMDVTVSHGLAQTPFWAHESQNIGLR